MLGIALMGIGDRERLLGPLRVMNAAITSITLFVVRLTPVGVFAIGAVTAGTMTGETLERLQVYFVVFAAASLLLAFWVLPLLVTAMTPFRYREVTGIARDALLTAFVANNAFIVLPILVERSKDLLRRRGLLSPESDSAAEVLVPILFNFPNAGKLLTLLFVPFAAWLAGNPFSVGSYAALFGPGSRLLRQGAGGAALPDGPLRAAPRPLPALHPDHDSQRRVRLDGDGDEPARVRPARGGGHGRVPRAGAAAAGAGGCRDHGRHRGHRRWRGTAPPRDRQYSYHRDEALRRMHAPRGASERSYAHRDVSTVPREAPANGVATLERIRARGTLRVGYDPGIPPHLWNAHGQLVGFDVELAQGLAEALGVEIEKFVPSDGEMSPRR